MTTVLIAIPSLLIGGTEYQTLRLVQALEGKEYHCVTVCYFKYDYRMVQLFRLAGSEVECLSAYGTRPKGVLKTYRMLSSGLRRIVRMYRPSIAHVQYVAPGAMPILILKRLGIKKIIATLHSSADIYRNLRLIHFLYRRVATIFTCVSPAAEEEFFGQYRLLDNNSELRKHNHFTISNCLPQNYPFAKAPDSSKGQNSEFKIKDSEFITIGVVSRLVPLKGVDLIIPAFAHLLQNISTIQNSIFDIQNSLRLVIVGDGEMRESMQHQQQELSIAPDKVQWMGTVVDSHQLSSLYDSFDILWMPSLTEGFGLVTVEAMAHGCIVVASRIASQQCLLHDSVDGLLFQKGNSDDLADKTLSIINNPDAIPEMSQKAIINANQYSFDIYKQKISALYSKL